MNRAMQAKILKAKKEAAKAAKESANNFGCTTYFAATRKTRYDWLKMSAYGNITSTQ